MCLMTDYGQGYPVKGNGWVITIGCQSFLLRELWEVTQRIIQSIENTDKLNDWDIVAYRDYVWVNGDYQFSYRVLDKLGWVLQRYMLDLYKKKK